MSFVPNIHEGSFAKTSYKNFNDVHSQTCNLCKAMHTE